MTACDRTEELLQQSAGSGKTRLTGSALTARQVIDQCRDAYQKLSSYEDEGYVRLAYRMSGELLEDRAPLSIAFERPGKLGIRAYSVEAGPTNGRWYLQLRDSGASAVASQVISRAVPAKADFAWLLADPAIAEELGAGLAGFPPQLDMLLGPNPMAGLVDDSALLQLDAPETVNGELCYTLQVVRGPATYKLWIHQESLLLRRLQLPSSNLTAEMLADKNITNVQLTIELPGIRTNELVDWQKFAVTIPNDAKLVSRFVPAPQPLPLDRLGVKAPAFRLRTPEAQQTANGPTAFNSADSQNKITVLTWLADHPACRETAAQMSAVAASVGASGAADRIQFINVWAEPTPAAGTTFKDLAKQWNLTGKLAIDSEAVGLELFGVREAPTVVVLDGDNRLQIFEERANPILPQLLPGLLVRLASGDDLAAEVLAHAKLERQRHAAELSMAAAVDANRQVFEQPTSYSSSVIALTPTGKDLTYGDAQIVALAVDDSQMIWTLTNDGKLRREDPSAQSNREFRTRWSITPNSPARLEVSADGKFLAFSQLNSRTVELFDTSIEQNRVVQFDSSEGVVDLHWMALAGAKSPRLAVLTSNNQTKLLDPNNREQLSGQCPAPPLALVPQSTADALVGGYVVMEDRGIEKLLLSNDSAGATPLGRPAAFVDKKSDAGKLPSKLPPVPSKLAFQPAAGPWKSVHTEAGVATLARGWIAQDEPGVFLLNEQLQQQWHYRLPLNTGNQSALIASANVDPTTGQALWAITQANEVVHLLRGDGVVTDHMQFADPIRGLGLVPVGNRLMLYVAHDKRVAIYQVGR